MSTGALINLNYIRRLDAEFHHLIYFVECSSLNWNRSNDFTGDDFIRNAKIYYQMNNLVGQLIEFYAVCTDFFNCEFETYIETKEGYDRNFDPFVKLNSFFVETYSPLIGSNYLLNTNILPPAIEQYAELVNQVHRFSELNQQWLHELSTDQEAETEEDIFEYDEESEMALYQIEIEHCLDGYNEFYQRVRRFIDSHQQAGDIQACVIEILRLFKIA